MTSKIPFPPIIALLLAAAPMAACAGPATPDEPPRGDKGMTLQQFQARHEKKMLAADTDGDGKVSRAEFVAANAGRGDPAGRFTKLDRNGDGMLDRSEIDAMLARRFRRMDTNGDGVVSPQERAAAHVGKGSRGEKAGARSDA